QRLQQNRQQVGNDDDAEELVAERRPAGETGGPVPRVHVSDRDEEAWSREGERLPPATESRYGNGAIRFRQTRRDTRAPPTPLVGVRRRRWRARFLFSQARRHVAAYRRPRAGLGSCMANE